MPQIMAAAASNINQEQIKDLLHAVKEGLLSFLVTVEFKVIKAMMEQEAIQYLEAKGKHNSERKASRLGKEEGQILVDGRKVEIEHTRVHAIEGKEPVLQTFNMFHLQDILVQMFIKILLYRLSTR